MLGRVSAFGLSRLRLTTSRSERLLIAPQDLRTADPTRATEMYAGRFAFAGKIVSCEGRSPFDMPSPSDEHFDILHGFGWLRHLRAAEATLTRSIARILVQDWIESQNSWPSNSWRVDIVSRRILAWLSQAPLILHEADVGFYKQFIRSLVKQVHYLDRRIHDAPVGVQRLQTTIALVSAGLCLAGQAKLAKRATRRLVDELERQILPDGGHVSRNPGVLIELLLDLLPLRQLFSARNTPPPSALLHAIDRMMPMLRFFRHCDGVFAHFNGMGQTSPDALATVFAYDDARGSPVANAVHSGYQRAEAGGTVLIMDTGRPPRIELSHDAHAGCLAFEMSAKRHRIIVNCGLPAINRDNWRQVSRATAAHSTATINDASSVKFLTGSALSWFLGVPIIAGPEVKTQREERDGAIIIRASHDGYLERFGVVHQRTLTLAADGASLVGEDEFEVRPQAGQNRFAIRFHLHPIVKSSILDDGQSVTLILPNRDTWTFSCERHRPELEESVYLGGSDGPRRTAQIVIYGETHLSQSVQWRFAHTPQ